MMAWLVGDALLVSILLGVGLAVGACLSRRSAAERHWVLAMVVACAIAVPALRAVLPSTLAAPVPIVALNPFADRADLARQMSIPPPGSPVVDTMATFTAARGTSAPSIDVAWALAWIWLGGVVVAASRLMIGVARLCTTAARAVPLETGPWRDACDAMCHASGVAAPVRLLHSDHPSLLATWGWRRPVVLLPAGAPAWAPDRIRVVLAHELAHVARRDWVHQLAAEGLRALHWFNPLAWRMCRRLRLEGERASDDAVLALGIEGPAYAAHLIDIARSVRQAAPPWIPAPAMVRPSSLEGRVRAMLDPTIVRHPVSRRARLLMTAAALAFTLPLAAFSVAGQYHALRGTLVDPTGRVLPDAVVVLTSSATATRYEVRSDASGHFEFVGLVPGTYALEARATGFLSHAEPLAILGDTERVLRLLVGRLQETISVVDDGRPDAGPDAAALARREEGRQRAAARQTRAMDTCAAGPPTDVGGNILAPIKFVHVTPRYPEQLRPLGVGGTVTMRAIIDVAGQVRDVRDVAGPNSDLDAAAVAAVRQWQFTTTLLNCEPIEVEMTVTVTFTPAR